MALTNGAAAWADREIDAEAPSRAQMQAALDEALAAFRRGVAAEVPHWRRRYIEARGWFSERGTGRLGSFEDACKALGISAERIRAELRRLELAAHAARIRRGAGSPFLSASPHRRS